MNEEILEKIKTLAYQNAFNDKQTKDFIDLVNSGTSIDKAIEMAEEGNLPKNISVKNYDTEKQQKTKRFQPNYINIDKVPYYPLPPSPPIWETKRKDVSTIFPKKEIFEIAEDSKWEFTENRKLENDEKPETFFKEVRLTASGTLFIDTKGKNEKYQGCKASLLKRGKNGKVTAEAGLSNDIYRIGTSPLNDWYVFMSSEGMLHGYNETLEKVLRIKLRG